MKTAQPRTMVFVNGFAVAAFLFFASVLSADDPPNITSLTIENGSSDLPTELIGRDARIQLLVTATTDSSDERDWTRRSTFQVQPPGIIEISANGLVTPLAEGTSHVIARDESGHEATTELTVSHLDNDAPVNFPGQVVPIFTKLGCNGGGCHGKIAGQNGFRLSLLGFEPREDYEYLIRESRSRRVSLAAPEQSLLLLKATNESPHGGGLRMSKDSHEYRMMRRWIAQGAPYGSDDGRHVVSIEVFPKQRRLATGETQQLAVIATYSDATTEDVTLAAVYESNDTAMADVSPSGLVSLANLVGDVAIMTRFQGHVTAFRADVPLGATDQWADSDWPDAKNVVDHWVYAKLRSLGIPPSGQCDDSTFLRRATLDIVGRLPTLDETNSYLASSEPNKRAALIDRLLDSDDYATYFASKWNSILRNRRSGASLDYRTIAFRRWIEESFRQNKPYDLFARDLITASGTVASNPAVAWLKQVPDTNGRIEDAAQLFLGQRIQCARCHHHPYEKWSQKDYTQMSAFFSLVSQKNDGDPGEPTFVTSIGDATAKHPKNGVALPPAGLDGSDLTVPSGDDPREHFASWMIDPENPFFARSLANRYWKHFMGRGLVEPEDDMRATNPPSNPELLDALATSLIEANYDLKSLVRLMCLSNTYATQSDALADNLGDHRSYSRFYPKRLQAETLLDAVDDVTGNRTSFAGMPTGVRAVELADTAFDSYFLTVFGRPISATACECERSQEANLAQSLHLLNSEEMQTKLAGDNARAAMLAAEERSDEEKVRELYMIALSRPPSDAEVKATLSYLSKQENRRQAYEDVIWSLVNSKEFLFNH